MTARTSSSNRKFERLCNSKLIQSWWSCRHRGLRCSADLAAGGAAPFVWWSLINDVSDSISLSQAVRNQCNAAFSKAKAEFLRKQQKNLESLADGSSAWWRKAKSIARISAPTENLPDLTTADGLKLTVSNELEKANLLAKNFATQCTGQDQHDDASPAPFWPRTQPPPPPLTSICSTSRSSRWRSGGLFTKVEQIEVMRAWVRG